MQNEIDDFSIIVKQQVDRIEREAKLTFRILCSVFLILTFVIIWILKP